SPLFAFWSSPSEAIRDTEGAIALRSSSRLAAVPEPQPGSCGRRDCVQAPLARHPLQTMRAALLERQARARHEILHGIADEHFARTRQSSHARADVNGDATELLANDLALRSEEHTSELQSR